MKEKMIAVKKNFFKQTAVFLAVVVMCVGFGFNSGGSALRYTRAAEVFNPVSGVSVLKNRRINSVSGISDSRYGVQLSASVSGSRVEIGDEMRGLFELNFRVFSQTAFEGSGTPFGESISNPALVLKTVSLIFTDTEDESKSFRVGIEGASKMNFATPQAYAEAGGRRGGVYTLADGGALLGNTTGANANGRYTALWRTSFSNTGYSSAEVKLSEPDANIIGFDPVSMRVYSKTSPSGGQKLIWDFSQEYTDGKKGVVFEPFASYRASLEFTEIAQGKTADILVYSLNGQSLQGLAHVNNAGPNVFADFSKQAVMNAKYLLPEPSHFDVLGDAVVSTSVSASLNGLALTVYNASDVPATQYSAGCYVIPAAAGKMTVTYTAKDSGFNGQPMNASAEVFAASPKTSYTLQGRMESGDLGVGTVVTVPAATAKSALSKKAPAVSVSVKKNGVPLAGYASKPANEAFTFTLGEAASYLVEYSAAGAGDVLSYAITASGGLPAFNPEFALPEFSYVSGYFVFPSAQAVMGGEAKPAAMRLYFPDGGAYEANSLIFEKPGKYTVEYSAEFSGTTYKKSYSLLVADAQATFTGGSMGSGVTDGGGSARYDGITGALIDAASYADVFTYSKKVDLSAAVKDELLIEIFNSAPWGGYGTEAPTVIIRDAHDPDNFLTIRAHHYWNTQYVWLHAWAPNQQPMGLRDTGVLDIDGQLGSFSNYNTDSYIGNPITYGGAFDYENSGMKLFYDAAEKAIYSRYGQSVTEANLKIIGFADDYQINPWKGFTTGEVYISVTNFKSIVVSEVYGNKLSESGIYGFPSDIFVDTRGYAESALPDAVAGKPYPVFDAFAISKWDGKTDVSVRVFRNYGQASYSEAEIKNGKFTPSLPGVYTIEYTARDAFHNITVKTLTVNAVHENNVTPVTLTLSSEPAATGTAGVFYAIPAVAAMSGGSGNLTLTVRVLNPSGTPVPLKGGGFTPLSAGIYTIEYKVADYIGGGAPNEAVITKTVNITAQQKPVLYDVLLPAAVNSGVDLKLPVVSAADYYTDPSGAVPPATSITVTLNGSPLTIGAGNIVRPQVAAGTSADMTVKYSASNSQGATEKTYTVKVINPGASSGFMANYFHPFAGSFTKTASSSGITVTSANSNAALQFINPVLAQGFYLNFSVPSVTYNNADRVIVTLYDSADMNVSVRFEIFKNTDDTSASGGSYFSINGGAKNVFSGNFYSENAPMGFTYSQNAFTVADLNGSSMGRVNETEAGEPFNGFPSGKVWFTISCGTVTGSGLRLKLTNINNQPLSDRSGIQNNIYPEFQRLGHLPLQVEAGQTVTIPAIVAQSVLAPRTTATIDIQLVGGETILSGASIDSPREFVIPQAGSYRVIYRANDGTRTFSQTYIIQVVEYEPPVLTVNGTPSAKVKVGATVTLPGASATDNNTKAPVIRIFVISPNRDMRMLDVSRTFIAAGAGQYIVRYYAYDDCANYAVREFVVIAE